jgi:hypothetical protein
MSAFTGADVAALEYDFTAIAKADGTFCTGKGIIPEPSGDALQTFVETLGRLEKETIDATKAAEAAGTDPVIDAHALLESAQRATAAFCQDTPSFDELAALPVRYFGSFSRWLQGEFQGPKA